MMELDAELEAAHQGKFEEAILIQQISLSAFSLESRQWSPLPG
jgi:hypothetical protein